MPLAAGQSLSFYEVLGPLGVGGMGEVYRARDTRLEREVAIKVLPEELAGDEERLRRFEREAKTLASLNHPNVAQVYGIDQVDDTCFIVMELVPGDDLATLLKRGPLPVDEALDVCRRIAEGLEAAHEAGVVHRDLKPANVRVTPDGNVKVLDFGLAKPLQVRATAEGTSAAESDSFLVTEEGVVLGTPTYMSPEQARGKPVDRRTDVWAFGCVLYECLTGRRVFGGETFSDVVAAIVEREPDWSALPARLPTRARALLRRCLDKEPRQRLRDVGEARVLLSGPLAADEAEVMGSTRSPLGAIGLVAIALAIVAAAWMLRPSPAVAARLSVALSPDELLPVGQNTSLSLSADSRILGWIGGPLRQVHVRSLDSYAVTALASTEDAECPFLSPNGEWVGFYVNDRMYKVRVSGGDPVEVVDESEHTSVINNFSADMRGASWGEDGFIVFAPSTLDGLFRVAETGGAVERLTAPDAARGERTHRWPQVIEGGRAVLFTSDTHISPEYYDDATIEVVLTDTGERHVLLEGSSMARYADGTLVFARAGTLNTQQLDTKTWSLVGSAQVMPGEIETSVQSGAVQFDLARDGSLAYAPGDRQSEVLRFAWRDRSGEPVPIDLGPGTRFQPELSPDGRRLVFLEATTSSMDICVHDFERGTTTRLTKGLGALGPLWTPDGGGIVHALPSGLYETRIGSMEPPRQLLEWADRVTPSFFADDGQTLVVEIDRGMGSRDLMRLDLATGALAEVVATPADERGGRLSPDGELMTYSSDESGREEIYVTRFSDPSVHWQVSDQGGVDPAWSADGRAVYYPDNQKLWAVDVESGPRLGTPRVVSDGFFKSTGYRPDYDVAADGRFLVIVRDEGDRHPPNEIRLRPRWVAEQRASIRER